MTQIAFSFADSTARATSNLLRGAVEIHTPEPLKCKNIWLRSRWSTHGSGNTTEGEGLSLSLFQGELSPGTHRFEFELPLPGQGPFTYHGHYTNLRWEAECHVDIPWAIDKKERHEFDYYGENLPASSRPQPPPQAKAHKRSVGLPWMIAGVFVASFSLLPASSLLSDGELEAGSAGTLFLLAFFALAMGAALFGFGAKRAMASRVVRRPHITLEPWPAHPGGATTYRFDFMPGAELEVNAITLRIKGCESVVYGAGTNITRYNHVFFDESFVLLDHRMCERGEPVSLTHPISLPAGAPPTMDLTDNKVHWVVSTHVDIPNWPDWHDDHAMIVTPAPS